MRPSQKNRNGRNKNGRKPMGNVVNRVFESAGPEGKVRGTPQQIIDKYQLLARDAQTSGDRVTAENFQQHAEHYIRLLSAAMEQMEERRQQQQQQQPQPRAQDEESGTSDEQPDPRHRNGNGNGNGSALETIDLSEDDPAPLVADAPGSDQPAAAPDQPAVEAAPAPRRRRRKPAEPKPETAGEGEAPAAE